MSSDRDEAVLDAISGRKLPPSGKVRATCPWCEEKVGTADRHRCLSVDTETGRWFCWRCRSAGVLSSAPGDEVEHRRPPARGAPPPPKDLIQFPPGHWSLYEGPGATAWSLNWARAYFKDRGVSEQIGREVGVGAIVTSHPLYAGRVVVPIRDVAGNLVGWSARSTYDQGPDVPKYLYPKGMDRSTVMFNPMAIDRATDLPLIIVEGVFDALPLWPDAVAVLGKPSAPQVARLRQARRPVVVALDGDAWREGKALALKLRAVGAVALRLPPKTDPGKTPPLELRAAAAQALTLKEPS